MIDDCRRGCKMIIPTREEITLYNNKTEELDRIINTHLEKNEYEQIIHLFDDRETQILTFKNSRAYVLQIIARLIKYEMDLTGKTSFESRNTAQMIHIFRTVSLYLRRLEFDFPEDLQLELWHYSEQEKLSMELLIGILMNNTKLVQKQKILDRLKKIIGERYE